MFYYLQGLNLHGFIEYEYRVNKTVPVNYIRHFICNCIIKNSLFASMQAQNRTLHSKLHLDGLSTRKKL